MSVFKWGLLCVAFVSATLFAQDKEKSKDRPKQTIENFDPVLVKNDLNKLFASASAEAVKNAKHTREFSFTIKDLAYSETKEKEITNVAISAELSALLTTNIWDKTATRFTISASAKRAEIDGKAYLKVIPSVTLGDAKTRTDSLGLYRHLMNKAYSEKTTYAFTKVGKDTIYQTSCTKDKLTWTIKGQAVEENKAEYDLRQSGCQTIDSAKNVKSLANVAAHAKGLKDYGISVFDAKAKGLIRRNPHFNGIGASEEAIFRRVEISHNAATPKAVESVVVRGHFQPNEVGAPVDGRAGFELQIQEGSVMLSGEAIGLLDRNTQQTVRRVMSFVVELSNPGSEFQAAIPEVTALGVAISERLITGEESNIRLNLLP